MSSTFANRSLDSCAESIRFSHFRAHGHCTARPPPVRSSVCSAFSGFEEPELRILDILQERDGFQLWPSCDPKPVPAHVELMPLYAITLLSYHRYEEPEFQVRSRAAPAEQGCCQDLILLPISGSAGLTRLAFHGLVCHEVRG